MVLYYKYYFSGDTMLYVIFSGSIYYFDKKMIMQYKILIKYLFKQNTMSCTGISFNIRFLINKKC